MDPVISESDIVYTFLHCLMRDEQDLRAMKEGREGGKEREGGRERGKGEVGREVEREIDREMVMTHEGGSGKEGWIGGKKISCHTSLYRGTDSS